MKKKDIEGYMFLCKVKKSDILPYSSNMICNTRIEKSHCFYKLEHKNSFWDNGIDPVEHGDDLGCQMK
jgi:hypothetical protein